MMTDGKKQKYRTWEIKKKRYRYENDQNPKRCKG